MKHCAAVIIFVFFGGTANADDGLVVRFTIRRSFEGNVATYTSGVLMKSGEAANLTIPNQYELRLESRPEGSDQVNLVVTLKDVSSGKPVYAGSGAATLKVGQSTTLDLHQLAQAPAKYEILIDTAYGQLPVAR